MCADWQPIESARLRLRRPTILDANAIFTRYSSDPVVTKYLGWPRHTAIEDARAFVALSDEQWSTWAAGPLLIEDLITGALLGSTGVSFDTSDAAVTGYSSLETPGAAAMPPKLSGPSLRASRD